MNSQFWVALVVLLVVGFVGIYIGHQIPSKSGAEMTAITKTSTNPGTADEKIANAMSAAPADVARDATILDLPTGSSTEMAVLRQGSNEWTCLPDDPRNPENDPVCVDKMGLEWFGAYLTGKTPRIAQNGVAYMLQGGSTASNDDPMATSPKVGEDWTHEPPHVMILPSAKLDTKVYGTSMKGGPWVMWANTPYQHLMVPVDSIPAQMMQ